MILYVDLRGVKSGQLGEDHVAICVDTVRTCSCLKGIPCQDYTAPYRIGLASHFPRSVPAESIFRASWTFSHYHSIQSVPSSIHEALNVDVYMFARVTRPAHVCLRCHLRLAQTESLRSTSQLSPLSIARLQSTAAARQEDECEEPRQHSYRTWRAGRTASLGVNSLGTPAEVIILPAVDRKIPTLPQDQEKDDDTGTLQAHIDSETQPLISEQLIENIDHIASKLDPNTTNLTVEEYTQLRRTLTAGFTTHQLRHYVKHKTSTKISKSQANRISTINLIIKGVWGLLLPTDQQVETSKEIDRGLQKSTYRVRNKSKFDFLLTDPASPLRHLARTYNVKIDLYRSDRALIISGLSQDTHACLKFLAKYVDDITVTQLTATADLAVLDDPALRDALKIFLQGIGQKYNLRITKDKAAIKIVHYKEDAKAAQAVREIRLAGESRKTAHHVHVWSQSLHQRSLLQPHPTPVEANWAIAQAAWGRLSSTVPVVHPLDSKTKGKVSEQLHERLEQNLDKFFNSNDLFGAVKSRMDVHYEMSAHFGKALFRTSPSVTDKAGSQVPALHLKVHPEGPSVSTSAPTSDEVISSAALEGGEETAAVESPQSNDKQAALDSNESLTRPQNRDSLQSNHGTASLPLLSNPTFTGQIGYATQQIVALDQWKGDSSMTSVDSLLDGQMLFRLVLRPPEHQKGMAPVLEILATSGPSDQNAVEIVRITAIHAERYFYLLLPEQHVDVKLVRQMKHDLYFKGAEVNEVHQGVVDILKDNLSKTSNLDSLESLFVPILEIPMPSMLRTLASKANDAVAKGRPFNCGRRKKYADKHNAQIEYVLKSVELLDVDARGMKITTPKLEDVPLAMDYMTLGGSNAVRHDLRLSEQSFLSQAPTTQLTLHGFVQAAIQVAGQLGHHPEAKQFGKLGVSPLPESYRAQPSSTAKEESSTKGQHNSPAANDAQVQSNTTKSGSKKKRLSKSARKSRQTAEPAAPEKTENKTDTEGTPNGQPSPAAEASTSRDSQEKSLFKSPFFRKSKNKNA